MCKIVSGVLHSCAKSWKIRDKAADKIFDRFCYFTKSLRQRSPLILRSSFRPVIPLERLCEKEKLMLLQKTFAKHDRKIQVQDIIHSSIISDPSAHDFRPAILDVPKQDQKITNVSLIERDLVAGHHDNKFHIAGDCRIRVCLAD